MWTKLRIFVQFGLQDTVALLPKWRCEGVFLLGAAVAAALLLAAVSLHIVWNLIFVDIEHWWNTHPDAPLGLSCTSRVTNPDTTTSSATIGLGGVTIPPPLFEPRQPQTADDDRIQVAYVVTFVDFQVPKLIYLLQRLWSEIAPCLPDDPVASADLVFFTPLPLSQTLRERILYHYHQLGPERIGCFHRSPSFLSLPAGSEDLPHIEGAAAGFYSLFPLLEAKYETFLLAEPDSAPVRSGFITKLVEVSKRVHCREGGLWQLGSLPFYEDTAYGWIKYRVDYHINGNSLYALGCPDFEDFKCRVQTFYYPRGSCTRVSGCATNMPMEDGYDHAMYRFRVHPQNFEYARTTMHRFAYGFFLTNRGEDVYDPQSIRWSSPSTYLVHSKSIFRNSAARQVQYAAKKVLHTADVCSTLDRISSIGGISLFGVSPIERAYQYLRTGEFTLTDALRFLCQVGRSSWFLGYDREVCRQVDEAGPATSQSWNERMPGKTYLWTMDFHGGPANCDIPLISEAGGVLHAEIDGICQFYGLCKDRLKVIHSNHWKEFDPTPKEIAMFTKAYQADPEFQRVDAFICHHPVANCELFLPFNRPIIIHATTRIEFGRNDPGIDWRLKSGYNSKVGQEKWKRWIDTLRELAEDKRNVIAANNVYDRDYITYFTGIQNVTLLPSWCGENVGRSFCQEGWDSVLAPQWTHSRPEVMIVPYRGNLDRTRYKTNVQKPFNHPILQDLRAVAPNVSNGTEVKLISELYSDANPLNMLAHPAVIIIPYQISTINLLELYRLNIPSFCPSLRLLKQWCRDHDLMWETYYGWPENVVEDQSHQKGVPDPNGHLDMDKNSAEWEAMFDHWMPKADFYQFDHITYFDSWEDFFHKYNKMHQEQQLSTIHIRMEQSNSEARRELTEQWRRILDQVRAPPRTSSSVLPV